MPMLTATAEVMLTTVGAVGKGLGAGSGTFMVKWMVASAAVSRCGSLL
ncbi:MAG: hypothetical protein QXU99_02945 [Candidatus Bathyarchaeia archaeon]